MSSGIHGRTALITGAARRLGRSLALGLARRGVHILLHHNSSRQEALSLVEDISALGVQTQVLQADFSDPHQAENLLTGLPEMPDILINSASIFPEDRFETLSAEQLDANIRINALAPALLSRAFAKNVAQGDIVNLLDSRITDYDAEHLSYHLSKRMLLSLTRILALELAPHIRVNAVAPGLILPPPGQGPEYLSRLAGSNPLQSWGNPQDIVRAVIFLLESPFVTGQIIYVDGGRSLKGSLYG